MKILDYTEASEFYLKALLLNPNDKAVQARRLDVENMYTMDCNRYSGIAESYFNDGDYEKAVELYEKVVEMNCFNSELAARRQKQLFHVSSPEASPPRSTAEKRR